MHPALTQRILENMSTAAVVLDEAFRVVALNPAAETLLETSVRRCAGLPFTRVARGDEATELAGRALAGGRACIERNMRLGRRLVDCTATPLGEDEDEGDSGGDGEGPNAGGGGAVLLEMADVEHHQRMSYEGRLLTSATSGARSPGRTPGTAGASSRRTGAPSSSTRSGTCRRSSRRGCCACSPTRSSTG